MQRSHISGRVEHVVFVLATIVVLVVGLSAGLAAASAASPTVSGPVTGGAGAIQPPNLNGFDLAQVGYQQSEYFLDGDGQRLHGRDRRSPTDGKWTRRTPATTAAYKTRVVVYRPIDPSKFNGTVIVEWLNVSGQVDANPDWTHDAQRAHPRRIRLGRCLRPGGRREPAQVSRNHSCSCDVLRGSRRSGALRVAGRIPVTATRTTSSPRPARRSATTRRRSSAG